MSKNREIYGEIRWFEPTEAFESVVDVHRKENRRVVFEEIIGEQLPPLMIAVLFSRI